MYHKYHTKGFVLGSFNIGEANKAYRIFTRELGLILASAQSSRKPESKLKSSLTDYSSGRFTFVQSKRGWKITDATAEQNLYFSLNKDPKFLLLARVFSLIHKLLPDEESNTELFDAFDESIKFLISENLSAENLKNFECLLILKILSLLGYLDREGQWQKFISNDKDLKHIEEFSEFRRQAVREINNSFKESQLV